MKYCNPDTCSECLYIGEGDSICEVSHELVLDNWQSVPHTIPQECPFRRQIIRQRRKAVRPPSSRWSCHLRPMSRSCPHPLIWSGAFPERCCCMYLISAAPMR